MNKCHIWIWSSVLILLSSCDPTYPILISNTTKEPVVVLVKTNSHFHTEKEKTGVTSDGFEIYPLNADESIQVGVTIAEIDDDLPFDAIKIVKDRDTISAFSKEAVKELFDKNVFGKLKKPYDVSIE